MKTSSYGNQIGGIIVGILKLTTCVCVLSVYDCEYDLLRYSVAICQCTGGVSIPPGGLLVTCVLYWPRCAALKPSTFTLMTIFCSQDNTCAIKIGPDDRPN